MTKNYVKKTFYREIYYVIGMFALAFGCAFMVRANLGISMVVAPAYVIYLKLSETLSFVTFGMVGYVVEGFLLILMVIALRKFKVTYLFSFVTAVLYGFMLDGASLLVNLISTTLFLVKIILFLIGMTVTSFGVACMLHTYFMPEVYDLIVREIPARYKLNLTVFKTCYDIGSCLLAVILSFCFFGFGHFEGVYYGTVVCALLNGFIIGRFSKMFDILFDDKNLFGKKKISETKE